MLNKISFILILTSCLFASCKKDRQITASGIKLTFSQDSVLFDTVFTKIGSTTQLLRVHNPNNGSVVISSIKLARGSASYYRLNVDGAPGTSFSNIEIAAKDSIYIFVQVTIDPNNLNNPFIYRDSILYELNGNQQYTNLIAFGQNAYYHMPNQKIIQSPTQALYYSLDTNITGHATVTWKNDKPHLIYGYLVVDSLHTLIIPNGTKIYVHNSGGLWVYRYGAIQINGTLQNPVTFQGDRLEQEYKDVPGQWDRIWINEGSTLNQINYAVIKNAYIGIHAGYSTLDGYGNTINAGDPKQLTLSNTIIQNCSRTGLLGHYYNITGGDNVIVNCGQNLLELDYGGSYSFYQCTFANYWAQTNNSQNANARTSPSFCFNNYFNNGGSNTLLPFANLSFGNCIFDGTLAEEFLFDTLSGGFASPYFFNYCALKSGMAPLTTYTGAHTSHAIVLNSSNIHYNNTTTYDFSLVSNSAPISGGNTSVNGGYNTDIKGNLFASPNPSMGAYGP